jgi:hypothetical protein
MRLRHDPACSGSGVPDADEVRQYNAVDRSDKFERPVALWVNGDDNSES